MKFPPLGARQRPRRFRPVNVAASVMTTMNLYMGVTSIFASIGLEFRWAAMCILMAIAFDMLDGFVARLTKTSSEFGKELDSLCDIVSFGVAPAVLVFMLYLPEGSQLVLSPRAGSIVGKTGSYMGIIYVICAALRLARYNTFQSNRHDSFIGLPSPAAGGSLAAYVLFLHYYYYQVLERDQMGSLVYAVGPMAVLFALLMVSTVRYPRNRFRALLLKPQHAFITLAFAAFVIAVVHYAVTRSVSLVLFPMAMAYILYGLLDSGWGWLTGRSEPPEPAGEDDSESDADLDPDLHDGEEEREEETGGPQEPDDGPDPSKNAGERL
ncbi:MAG: CDP-diacylglycerol--serine O-phosphatidyltransferase [Candidatus Hydrogenedentes bacterium]|nr:CDP-diacylglycerol--serine O-phosphatidyltransferase [Candidatus Hydrogenedentota bacterium]